MVDLIEARLDVRLDHPLVGAGGRSGGSRRSRPGPGARAEAVAEHGWKSASKIGSSTSLRAACTTRSRDGRDAQPAQLAAGLGDHPLPHRQGRNVRALSSARSSARNRPRRARLRCSRPSGRPRPPSVRPGCSAPAAMPPADGRVADEVVEVVEPTVGSSVAHRCSLVWIRSTRSLRLIDGSATARRCSPATSWPSSPNAANSLPPFAMWPAFPASDYYGDSAPPRAISRRRACPPPTWLAGGEGSPGMVPTFTARPVDGGGAQLFPCSLATSTPQTFLVASAPTASDADRSPTVGIHDGRACCCPAHIHQVRAGGLA